MPVVAGRPYFLSALLPVCSRRLDVIYDVIQGRIFLIGTVKDPSFPQILSVTVPPNATTDILGQPNLGGRLRAGPVQGAERRALVRAVLCGS